VATAVSACRQQQGAGAANYQASLTWVWLFWRDVEQHSQRPVQGTKSPRATLRRPPRDAGAPISRLGGWRWCHARRRNRRRLPVMRQRTTRREEVAPR